jgi:hypothetical protein
MSVPGARRSRRFNAGFTKTVQISLEQSSLKRAKARAPLSMSFVPGIMLND